MSDWGHHFWHTLHYVALGFPDAPTQEDERQYATFYNLVPAILPCSKCRAHFRQIIESIPVESYVSDRRTLFSWTVLVHNEVNRALGKPAWDEAHAWKVYNDGDTRDGAAVDRSAAQRRTLAVAATVCILALVLVVVVTTRAPSSASPASAAIRFNRTR